MEDVVTEGATVVHVLSNISLFDKIIV